MKDFLLIISFFCFYFQVSYGQASQNDIQLAQYYFAKGDYNVAIDYYEKIYKKDQSKRYFLRYLECLENTNEIEKANALFKKQAKKFPDDLDLKLDWAQFQIKHNNRQKGEDIIEKIIDEIPLRLEDYSLVINALIGFQEFDFATQLIKKGEKTLGPYFHPERAKINVQLNQKKEAIENILNMMDSYLTNSLKVPMFSIEDVADQLNVLFKIQNTESQDYKLMESTLIEKIQKSNNNENYLEILNWLYIQSNEFEKAFKISLAIDKRSQVLKGSTVYELALSCMEAEDFKTAVLAFRYLIEEKTSFLYEGQEGVLKAGFKQITEKREFTTQEIEKLLTDYVQILNTYGKNNKTKSILLEYAHILAFYTKKIDQAILELNNALSIRGLSQIEKAEIKMELGNAYLVKGEIWEASLLYSQVEKDFKFEEIGDLAKFKNAKIFYFDGEFEYAQSQLDVLKGSTSKLISNDAIQLSINITENFGIDSNFQAMSWFATSELYIEQHKFSEAMAMFDSISLNFPRHSLGDDILFKKGTILENQGDWQGACDYYQKIIENYSFDILADDALYRLGSIQEKFLNNPEKAMEYYKKIILNYKDSLFCSEARKRIRILRGDSISDIDL